MALWQRNTLLILLALLIAVIPLAFAQNAEWGGADKLSVEAIQELQSDYEPWFESVFSPGENERYFFGFQALLGAAIVTACIGWLMGYRRGQLRQESRDLMIAGVLCTVTVIVAIALFFVETEFGEIQAFLSAMQGVLIGLAGFFIGYPMGKRSGLNSAPSRRA